MSAVEVLPPITAIAVRVNTKSTSTKRLVKFIDLRQFHLAYDVHAIPKRGVSLKVGDAVWPCRRAWAGPVYD
jgi:hypothetical protein